MDAELLDVTDVRDMDPQLWQRMSVGRPSLRLEILQEHAAEPGCGVLIYSVADPDGMLCAAVGETQDGAKSAADATCALHRPSDSTAASSCAT